MKTPFIPAFAWPGSVQRYACLPFASVTVNRAVPVGATCGVALPAIEKSCGS